MIDEDARRRFERLALPHLDAAYNLARWLTRNDHDARDVVQEACLRALRHFAGFRGEQARPWLLQIVRHTCFTWLKANRPSELVALREDGTAPGDDGARDGIAPAGDEPLAQALRQAERAQVNQALAALPMAYREVIVLRELEDLAYKDIARIVDIPLGTVMSRLARARGLMRDALAPAASAGAPPRPALHAVRNDGRKMR